MLLRPGFLVWKTGTEGKARGWVEEKSILGREPPVYEAGVSTQA